jgi:hypothetical protein
MSLYYVILNREMSPIFTASVGKIGCSQSRRGPTSSGGYAQISLLHKQGRPRSSRVRCAAEAVDNSGSVSFKFNWARLVGRECAVPLDDKAISESEHFGTVQFLFDS